MQRKMVFYRRCEKFLNHLVPKHKQQIRKKLEELLENPEPNDKAMLKGISEHYWRTDIGEYRIIYQFDTTSVTIFAIGKRNDGQVYKDFFRKA